MARAEIWTESVFFKQLFAAQMGQSECQLSGDRQTDSGGVETELCLHFKGKAWVGYCFYFNDMCSLQFKVCVMAACQFQRGGGGGC